MHNVSSQITFAQGDSPGAGGEGAALAPQPPSALHVVPVSDFPKPVIFSHPSTAPPSCLCTALAAGLRTRRRAAVEFQLYRFVRPLESDLPPRRSCR